MSDLKELYYSAFRDGEFEFPALFLSNDETIKYAIRFPLYVEDQDSYAIALNKAMSLCSYNNNLNCAGLFVATDHDQYIYSAKRNKITLFEIEDGGFEEVVGNPLDNYTKHIMREYLSVYSRKDYTNEIIEMLHEQGFEVHAN